MSNPVVIHGVHYPSQRAAAQALGVSDAAICNALSRGRLDAVGSRKTPQSAADAQVGSSATETPDKPELRATGRLSGSQG